jgi:hypothetical protein
MGRKDDSQGSAIYPMPRAPLRCAVHFYLERIKLSLKAGSFVVVKESGDSDTDVGPQLSRRVTG